jgi:hypothetical protein
MIAPLYKQQNRPLCLKVRFIDDVYIKSMNTLNAYRNPTNRSINLNFHLIQFRSNRQRNFYSIRLSTFFALNSPLSVVSYLQLWRLFPKRNH